MKIKAKIKTLFFAGIIGIAAVAGVFEALTAPRRKEESEEEKKKKEKAKPPEGGNCDGL